MSNNTCVIDFATATYANRVLTFGYNVEKAIRAADIVIIKHYPVAVTGGTMYYNFIADVGTNANETVIAITEYALGSNAEILASGRTLTLDAGYPVAGWA